MIKRCFSSLPSTFQTSTMRSTEYFGRQSPADPFKVLVVGGSYAGLSTALNLLDLCNGRSARTQMVSPTTGQPVKVPVEITMVDERDGFFHLISAPLALASKTFVGKPWTSFPDIPALKSVRFVQGSAKTVDCKKKRALIETAKGATELEYDFFVAASGLRRVWPVVPQSTAREAYLEEASAQIRSLENASEGIVVVGGGAVGIEMAAEIKLVMPEKKVTLIHSRDKLCSSEPLPGEFKAKCLAALHEAGVETILGQRVLEDTKEDGTHSLKFADGRIFRASEVIYAISKSTPSTSYLPEKVLDEGYVKVTPRLGWLSDCENSQHHFALGDIVKWSGIKRCGAAIHMGQYAAHNIHQSMAKQLYGDEPKFMELEEIPPMIAIAIGKQAVAYHPAEGTTCGTELMERMFGDDLWTKTCWEYLGLGKEYP
ncbi:hypothetical protein PV04_09726 [Phialophora macrospora]|uniref:FAD/NAD(P)-binding domain-containing protein n=1 Tax=Phialophora macrospora TaxID=1851006 RepID=A0A0D2FY38_9EURO|nr:hypothetical protein PV04_09726 [Phialophora macrospora]